jgi:hypothetical protein
MPAAIGSATPNSIDCAPLNLPAAAIRRMFRFGERTVMRVFAILALTLLAGCGTDQLSTNDPPIPPILCKTGPDCDAKWTRAIAWIAQNSGYKTHFQTAYMIQTLGPAKDSASLAYRVSKLPKGGEDFEIKLNGECAKMFGCKPTIAESRAMFAEYLNSAPPPPPVPPPPAPSTRRRPAS